VVDLGQRLGAAIVMATHLNVDVMTIRVESEIHRVSLVIIIDVPLRVCIDIKLINNNIAYIMENKILK
jgi:hypothetical protein